MLFGSWMSSLCCCPFQKCCLKMCRCPITDFLHCLDQGLFWWASVVSAKPLKPAITIKIKRVTGSGSREYWSILVIYRQALFPFKASGNGRWGSVEDGRWFCWPGTWFRLTPGGFRLTTEVAAKEISRGKKAKMSFSFCFYHFCILSKESTFVEKPKWSWWGCGV